MGSYLIGHIEIRHSLLYYGLMILYDILIAKNLVPFHYQVNW